MKTFRNLGILGILLAIIGCTTIKKIEDGISKVKMRIDQVDAKLEAIDTNKDGKWSIEEVLAAIGITGGTVAALAKLIGRLSGSTKEKVREREETKKDRSLLADLDRRMPPLA